VKATRTKTVYCSYCSDEISSRGNLVTTLQCPELVAAYHIRCYGLRALGFQSGGMALNSRAMTLEIAIFGPLGLVLFVFDANPIWLMLAAIGPGLRLLSWLLVERDIERSS